MAAERHFLSCPSCVHRGDFQKSKEAVLAVLVDKVTNVRVVVPDAWGITTKH